MKNILLCLFTIGTFCVSDAADKDAMQVDDSGPSYVSYKKIHAARVRRKLIDAQLGAEILDMQRFCGLTLKINVLTPKINISTLRC